MVRSIKNLIAAILIAVSGYLFWTEAVPKYDNTSLLKADIEAKTITLETRNRILERITKMQSDYQEKYTEIQRLAMVVPEKKNLAELVSTLEDISFKTSILLGEVSISSGAISANEPFNLINLDTSMRTSYDALLNLLAHIEKNIRLIDTTALTIGVKNDIEEGDLPLEVQVKTEAFYLRPLSEIEAESSRADSNSSDL
jgi:Tfp pilus assembly protein PilO